MNYSIVKNEAEQPLVIQDVSDIQGGLTVTNSAEQIVAELIKNQTLAPRQRLFYYDSYHDLDEILIHNGKFSGFRPGPQSGEIDDIK